jgi:hypothetical protein
MCKLLYFLNSADYIAHFILFGIILINFGGFHPKYSNNSMDSTQTSKFLDRKSFGKGVICEISVADQKENQSLLFITESCDLNFMYIV